SVWIDMNGTPNVPSDDFLQYTPDAYWHGTDTFVYSLTDIYGQTSTATVTITVADVNCAPSAGEDWAHTTLETAVNLHVLANDSDGDDDTLAISAVGTPLHGTATINDNGTGGDTSDDYIVYTPEADFTGVDFVTYTLSDGEGGTTLGM